MKAISALRLYTRVAQLGGFSRSYQLIKPRGLRSILSIPSMD
jgi:hypothetical protein